MAGFVERLLIVSHVCHYRFDGRLHAYGPYAREIDLWADFFPTVRIAAPSRTGAPPPDSAPFTRSNIEVVPQLETGGDRVSAKLLQIALLPALVGSLVRAMRDADAIHVRCPGNLGLLGVLLAPMFSSRLVAKYADQWPAYPDEGWAARFQKVVLRSRWWKGPVTVYGEWPDQSPHVVPFFTSMLSESQIERARRAAAGRRPDRDGLRLLYVGRLTAWKRIDTLLEAVSRLVQRGLKVHLEIVGEGPARQALAGQVHRLGVERHVHFAGGLPFDAVLGHYEASDVLVMASNSEGWPKAIAEAMAFGVIAVGSDRGLVPQMLGEGRGYIVPPGDIEALSEVLQRIASSPGGHTEMRAKAAAWGQRYSIEAFQRALAELLTSSWQTPLSPAFARVAGPAEPHR
jgi:glycosyltransferase involved in cell wall biosynthesis